MSTLTGRLSTVLFLLILWINNISAKEVRIVCYYTNWSVYRPGDAKFNPQNINPYLCTHLVYAFGGFTKENTLKPFDKYQDVEKGGYAKFVGLKTYNKNLKTLLAIGGWNEGSTRFSPMVANAERRKELVKNTIKFLRQNHFDGLDLDWEYPSFRDGGKSRDRDNYAQLVQELREEFERESEKTGRQRLLLTMAVPAGIEYIKKGYDIPKLTKYLDWMNILSYDYHSAYEPAVNHHSPLYPTEEESEYSYDIDLNIDYTIKHYIQSGAEKSKLVLGIPTYGRSYTLYNPDANEIGAPADGPGEMGEATRENGYLAYYEICENIKSDEWQVETPYPEVMGPYAFKETQWVSYDDADIARRKAEYVAEHGLGGIMFWSIDNDDFRGKCGGGPYPIIEAAKEALLKAYGLSDSNLLEATKKPIKSRTRGRTRGTTKSVSITESTVINSGGKQSTRRKSHRISGKSETGSLPRRRRPTIKKSNKSTTTESNTLGSSLLVTPSYTTPAPPSTPDSGGDFKCEDEGFFPHPKDCKKYFWCLSGPSDLGIIAHQFTCPAGLYFNKAASSCDYTQNVLCNKKISKSSATSTAAPSSTTISTTSTTSISSTRRSPPKITAATSRTTYKSTTAEPEYEEEYEYYDDEEEEIRSKDTEEDPRVIKELIELIKKAGGLEELEKQLKLQDDNSPVTSSGSTTPGSISKSLFQRVLGRTTLRDSLAKTTPRYNFVNRNSRGPQNEGISRGKETDVRPSKSRPQYTSIIRTRPSTAATVDEDVDEEEEYVNQHNITKTTQNILASDNSTEHSRTFYRKSQPEYVTIRRQRISTTTAGSLQEDDIEGRSFSRSSFKQLGEDGEFTADTEENDEIVRNTLRSSTISTPYVTIQRSRPTTSVTETTGFESESKNRGNGTIETEGTTVTNEYVTIRRQRPSVEGDLTRSKYIEIRTRGTTTAAIAPEPDNTDLPVTTIRYRSTTVIEKELTTTPTSNGIGSNITLNKTDAQADIFNLVEENTVENANSEATQETKLESSGLDAKDVINNIREITKVEEGNNEATTIISIQKEEGNTEANKNKTTLLDTRPFSINFRRTTVTPTTTSETSPVQQSNKVSVSTTPRTTFRKKAFGARGLLVNRNKQKITDNAGNKENSVIDFETKAQYDDNNDNELVNRKRFRNSISSDKISENSFEEEPDSKGDAGNSEYQIRLRNRGQSRFTLQTIGTTTPRSRIRIVTSEPDVDYETTEYVRKYRPDISYEIADLSSLTAVDLKDSSARKRNGFGRRRRPTVVVTESAITPTTTRKPEPSLKTSARTVPLARKFLENSAFNKGRRIRLPNLSTSSTTEGSTLSTTNNEAQATQKRFISRLRRPTQRVDVQNATLTSNISLTGHTNISATKLLPKAPRFRKFSTVPDVDTSTNGDVEFRSVKDVSTTRKPQTIRRRKILRKLRVSTQRPIVEPISPSASNKTLQHQFESVPKNNTISAITGVTNFSEESLNINIITKSDLLDINKNQTQLDDVLTTTLPTTSTSNYMREEGNVNTTSALQDNINIISESDKSDLIDDKLKDDIDSKSSEDDDEEEDENIKLSESIVRENSQLSDFQTGNVIRLFEKPGSKVVNQFRPDNSKEENIKRRRPVTEPSIIIRTRKIIRKLNPTETPSITDDGNKKVRKVVRRLRPTVSPINQIDSNLEKTRGNANTGFLSRRRFGSNRPSTSTTENINQENVANSKSLFSKRRFNSFNRKGAPDNSAKSKVIGTKPEKGINKSIYNRVKLSSTTSTTEATTNILTELPLITEVSTNDYQSSTDDQFTTSILSSTATNDSTTDQTFEDISTSEKLYISHSSTEQGLDVENNVSTEIVLENFSSTDSIDYTSDMEGIQTLNTEPLDTEIKQAQSSTPKEDTFSTDTILRSTTPLPSMIIEHTDEGVISTVFEESSASTYIDETSTLNESSTATTSDTSPEITIKTTEVTVPTKRIVSTTESALNRLLKRRRFGLNSNITDLQESGQIQGTESGKKDRLPSLNTRLRLKPFSQSTTEKQSETKENIDSSNYQIRTDHAAIVDIGNSSVTLSSESSAVVSSDTTDIINQEGTVFETQSTAAATTNRIKDADTSTNPTLYLTTDYHNDTSETQSIVLSNEITSTLFTQSYATDITREQSTEMANSDIESSTTLDEDISENTDTTSALLIFSTQELAVFTDDNDTSIVSNFVTTLKPSTTTIESTASETNLSESESTADTTPVATVIATSTTTRRPNRLFRPIDSRPKYTVKYRPSESTSSIASTLDSSTKSYSRYKFRSKNRNRFTFSSTTEKYDENEELGYGPVKEFKSILRVSANIEGRNEYYESKKLGEDDEEEYIDEEENISDEENNDNENSNAYIRSSLYNRAFPYKPIKPVIQKPSTFTKAEEAEYDEHEFDNTKEDLEPVVDEHSSTKENLGDFTEGENDEKINTTKISESPEVAVSPVTRASNAPIDVLNQKSTTRTYKGFRSTTPATIQNLSDINIAVINERNKNLFSKTRKVNTPVAFSGASSRSRNNNTIYNSPHLQNKPLELDNSGKYNTPHYTNTSEIVSVNETIPESNKTITIDVTQSIPDELLTTKALPSSEVTANKTTETIPDSKSTQVTEKSSTLLHIFAETEAPISETTITSNQVAETTNKNKKIEKLIEINRVIEVHAKEEFKNGTGVVGTVSKAEPIVDKIGSVSRITEIKVVEDKNATANDTNNNSPIDLVETSRTEKKMEIANTKDNNFNIPIVTSSDITQINQINIDTVSLHKITPRPFYKAETSTIPLEGLFQTDSPLKYHHSIKSDSPNEILQGEHSRYVNVRILEQDITDPNAKRNLAAKYVPIKLLRDEEEITMKADVVEVRPEHRHQTIKIAPIKVSLQTKV